MFLFCFFFHYINFVFFNLLLKSMLSSFSTCTNTEKSCKRLRPHMRCKKNSTLKKDVANYFEEFKFYIFYLYKNYIISESIFTTKFLPIIEKKIWINKTKNSKQQNYIIAITRLTLTVSV